MQRYGLKLINYNI